MTLKFMSDKPLSGYWDGGARSVFNWDIDGQPQKDGKGLFVRVGSWEANSWFNVSVGKTDKMTLSNAKRHLSPILTKKGITGTWEYIA